MPQCVQVTLTCCRTRNLFDAAGVGTADAWDGGGTGDGGAAFEAGDGGGTGDASNSGGAANAEDGGGAADARDGGGSAVANGGCLDVILLQVLRCLIIPSRLITIEVQ